MVNLKAPFPWFGGKSRVSHLVWDRFGNTPNYVEPFFGSGAVLLGRPGESHNETVNDKDAYLSNFWRALATDPEAVAYWADWPVSEADLHARHQWLVDQVDFRERMLTDPDFHDPKVAGWWVWGISQWIGSGWCQRPEWRGRGSAARAPRGLNRVRPHLQRGGQGVSQDFSVTRKRPILRRSGNGVHRKLPWQDNAGVNRQIPQLKGNQGVNRQIPRLSADMGINVEERATDLEEYFMALYERLRRVRVCCGDWTRILGPSPTTKIGLTAVFLDPPYSVEDRDDCYNEESRSISHEVSSWAIEHGDDPLMRIALCGYEGEHVMPDSWECVQWKANGGYANQRADQTQGQKNAGRERVWFSPHCLKATLFTMDYEEAL